MQLSSGGEWRSRGPVGCTTLHVTCYSYITLHYITSCTALHYTAGISWTARGAGMLQWPAAWAALPHLDIVGNNQHCTEHEAVSSLSLLHCKYKYKSTRFGITMSFKWESILFKGYFAIMKHNFKSADLHLLTRVH